MKLFLKKSSIIVLVLQLSTTYWCYFIGHNPYLDSNKIRSFTSLKSRFISDITKDRIRNGKISVKELDRIYEPNSSELERIQHPLSKGYTGVVFSLEGSLLNSEALFAHCWTAFAADIGMPKPGLSAIKDVIGLDFSESTLALGWNLKAGAMNLYEKRYYELLNILIDKIPISAVEGSQRLIQSIIDDSNKISVVTSLPRELATKLLRITTLAKVFEDNRIDPECLVHPQQQSDWLTPGQTHFGKLVVRCLAVMEKPTILTLLVDSNRRNILLAKRMGISCIALKGFSFRSHHLSPSTLLLLMHIFSFSVLNRKCSQCLLFTSSRQHCRYLPANFYQRNLQSEWNNLNFLIINKIE